MLPHPTAQELFNGDTIALHDPDTDLFIAKGHHDAGQLDDVLRSDANVPPLFRGCDVTPGSIRTAWAVFAWHNPEPECDAVGEVAPWCQCGLDEAGARVDWYPTPADQSTPGAIPVTWFNAVS